jgi:excisionase family DNA binding protein
MSIASTGLTAAENGVVRAAYSVAETADLLGLSEATIYRLIGRGALASVLIGRSRRIPASAIQKALTVDMGREAV